MSSHRKSSRITKQKRPQWDPRPLIRNYLRIEAEKIKAPCSLCRQVRPVMSEGDLSVCGPCHYGNWLFGPEKHVEGKLCGDCAFRPGSPERQPSEEFRKFDVDTPLEYVRKHSSVFWCHKPFFEEEQEWGYDPKTQELIPLYGEHWQACEGWFADMRKRYGVRL